MFEEDQFQPGDIVECLYDFGVNSLLKKGEHHTVLFMKNGFVYFESTAGWLPHRFRLVKKFEVTPASPTYLDENGRNFNDYSREELLELVLKGSVWKRQV